VKHSGNTFTAPCEHLSERYNNCNSLPTSCLRLPEFDFPWDCRQVSRKAIFPAQFI